MPEYLQIIFLTAAAGLAIPIGGILASFEHIGPRWLENEFRHFLIALGGGILLGAVSVVLVPEGTRNMAGSLFSIPLVLLGGTAFFWVERWLAARQSESPQLAGMLLDYVPEAVALGGLMASGGAMAVLLAVMIGLQNLPEGFNAYRELDSRNHHNPRKTLLFMLALAALGPVAGILGYAFLSSHPTVLGGIMLFASGGILYLLFQDIAPQSRLDHHWGPPLGAVLGFCIALFSKMLTEAH